MIQYIILQVLSRNTPIKLTVAPIFVHGSGVVGGVLSINWLYIVLYSH